ncbi:MAG: ImmA/IrrE family metallo-endopeptidase [Pseudomonadota bacterium]
MLRPKIKKSREKAWAILSNIGIAAEPVDVHRVADYLGLHIEYSRLDDEISGMIYFRDGKTIVGINSGHHKNRQRFTIAHECGHYVLHRETVLGSIHVDKRYPGLLRSDLSSKGIDSIEIEANQFAAALLVPESFLIPHLEGSFPDIEDDEYVKLLARRFQVSFQMMSNCLSNLRTH